MHVSFAQNKHRDFHDALHKRVNDYFASKGLSRNHNSAMIWKSVFMFALYLIPFVAILAFSLPVWMVMVLYFIMGMGVAGIGMSVMHDANHAGYSKNQNINRLMGYSMYLLGADSYNWKIKHNKLHHVFTNIYGKDEDIKSRAVLRFAFAAPLKGYHRYQHLYAWFLYTMMSLSMIFSDISNRLYYRKKGVTNISRATFRRSIAGLIATKIIYLGIFLVLPVLVTSLLWWHVFIGFLIMHLTAGFILSLVFQMAHVVEGPSQIVPDENGKVKDSLLVHQLKTTSDFSRNNKILSWFLGGLNFQVEHHLFPRICHIHYPALSQIVEKTTREYSMPYHVHDSFAQAFRSHFRTLKKLGRVKSEVSQTMDHP